MKSKVIKNRYLLVTIMMLLIALCAMICYNIANSATGQELSEAQISMLREKYPICGNEEVVMGSLRTPKINEIKEIAESFVYGEITGDISTYTKHISTGDLELDKKRTENGISDTFTFYEYTISVIDDTEGVHKPGDKITISANIDFIDYNPNLSDGMKIIVPTIKGEDDSSRYFYNVYGMYYVTDDGYAISAFDENKAMMKKTMSGIRVENLMNELKN